MAWRGTRLQKIMRLARTFAAHPVVVSRALPGEIRQWYQWHRRGEDPGFEVDEAWDEHLHKLLGAPWPCPKDQRLDEVMADIGAVLEASGWGFGRDTYAWYADGDSSLCRALWCVALHTRPEVVIETGVAHGVTSRIVLEALAQNQPRPPVEHRSAVSLRSSAARGDRHSRHRRVPPPLVVSGRLEQAATAAADRRGRPRGDVHPRQPAHRGEHGVRDGAGGLGHVGRRGHAGGRHRLAHGFRDLRQAASRIPDHHLSIGGQERDVRHRGQHRQRLRRHRPGSRQSADVELTRAGGMLRRTWSTMQWSPDHCAPPFKRSTKYLRLPLGLRSMAETYSNSSLATGMWPFEGPLDLALFLLPGS